VTLDEQIPLEAGIETAQTRLAKHLIGLHVRDALECAKGNVKRFHRAGAFFGIANAGRKNWTDARALSIVRQRILDYCCEENFFILCKSAGRDPIETGNFISEVLQGKHHQHLESVFQQAEREGAFYARRTGPKPKEG
jgi:hypothetical protein